MHGACTNMTRSQGKLRQEHSGSVPFLKLVWEMATLNPKPSPQNPKSLNPKRKSRELVQPDAENLKLKVWSFLLFSGLRV